MAGGNNLVAGICFQSSRYTCFDGGKYIIRGVPKSFVNFTAIVRVGGTAEISVYATDLEVGFSVLGVGSSLDGDDD